MDSATLQKQMQDYSASMQNPLDLYNKATTDLGVNDVRNNVNTLRNSVLNTENLLNGVDASVTGRTQGSLVTEAQRQRLVNLERQPIAQQFSKLQGAYQNEDASLRDLMGRASEQANLGYQGQQQKYNSLKDLYSAATAREAEQRRQQEADRAFALQQQQFEEQKRQALAAASRSSAVSAASQPTRDEYNVSLDQIEGALRNVQASGYNKSVVSQLPSRQAAKNALIQQFRGVISPQEINGYVDSLYNRYYIS